MGVNDKLFAYNKHPPKVKPRRVQYFVDITCPYDPEYRKQYECSSIETCKAKIEALSKLPIYKGCKLELMICL